MLHGIKTAYRGVVFQSTLEADWAKTLDSPLFGMVWQNEPEGLKLPDGQNYRPDLYLPRLHTWVEVKGPHDQRIDKPGLLAAACLHAPGCGQDQPLRVLQRPATVPAASCACGYGPDFPFENVVVARPANGSKATWEAPHGVDQRIGVMVCGCCHQRSFTDIDGVPVCRRCHQDATGSPIFPSGSLPFSRVEPPRGRRNSAKAAQQVRSLSS